MIRNLFVLLLVAGNIFTALGQMPKVRVPAKMEFAGMKLHLTRKVRKRIQTNVDNLRRNKKYFKEKARRANMYFPIIERIFREENLPLDFKFLVLQESSLVSDAVSSSNAVGYWQFKTNAAQEMGLKMSNGIDERKNITASTRAAAGYLKRNNAKFNNWVYALLAYNLGSAGIGAYTKDKYLGADKMRITDNMYWYVTKFLSYKIAFRGAVDKFESDTTLLEYTGGKGEPLKKIARKFQVPERSVTRYNKWIEDQFLSRQKVPDDTSRYYVIIPVSDDKAEKYFAEYDNLVKPGKVVEDKESGEAPVAGKQGNEDDVKTVRSEPSETKINESYTPDFTPPVLTERHGLKAIRAKEGNTIAILAHYGGISRDDFLKYNDMEVYKKVEPGQIYYLEKKNRKAPEKYHVLQPGQTMWNVAQKYGIKLRVLRWRNQLMNGGIAETGLKIWLNNRRPFSYDKTIVDVKEKDEESGQDRSNSKDGAGTVAFVQDSDQGRGVTNDGGSTDKQGVTQQRNADKNKKQERKQQTGSRSPKQSETRKYVASGSNNKKEVKDNDTGKATKKGFKKHTVSKGQTLFGISRLYGVEPAGIREWNDLNSNNISVGQVLYIKKQQQALSASAKKGQDSGAKGGVITHTVEQGETLFSIAQTYDVSVKAIKKWNNKTSNTIEFGEELKILKR